MGRNPGVRLNSDGKELIDQYRENHELQRQDPRILKLTHVSMSTWKRFVSGEPVSRSTFKAMCESLELTEWENFIDSDAAVDGSSYVGLLLTSNSNAMDITLTIIMKKNITDIEQAQLLGLFQHLQDCLNDVSLEVSEEDGTFFIQGNFKDEDAKEHALICLKMIEKIQSVSFRPRVAQV